MIWLATTNVDTGRSHNVQCRLVCVFSCFLQRSRGFTADILTKVVILAGGLGTRLTEETETRPKPMVEIGGKPILWHIMKLYAHYGFKEFVIATRLQRRRHQALLP